MSRILGKTSTLQNAEQELGVLHRRFSAKSRNSCSKFIAKSSRERASAAMSGAQGALPPGSRTDTTYESKAGSTTRERVDDREDSHGVEVKLAAEESPAKFNAAGHGGPAFGDPDKEKQRGDLGVAGTGVLGSATTTTPMKASTSMVPMVDKAVDFANYFCTYSFLYHQKEMLSDKVRMDAYHSAIFKNKRHFQGKTVLDVGTGSGILAIWSAQAGAKKVYAVEATNMAAHARTLAHSNGVGHIVEVIQGSIEDVCLPEKVDVIISEWMGYFLVRESMFDSVLFARDKWLKPSGVMYPSHARMWVAPVQSKLLDQRNQDYQKSMVDWSHFTQETNEDYGVDMSALSNPFLEEQKKYFLQTSVWNNLYPRQLMADPVVIKEFDCHTATLQDVAVVQSDFTFELNNGEKLCGFAGWFDVHFRGNYANPATEPVELTTAPSDAVTTHWGQQVFLLYPPLVVEAGDVIHGSMSVTRSQENHRLMDVDIKHQLNNGAGRESKFFIE